MMRILTALAAFMGLATLAAPAVATTSITFTGACTDCTGFGTGTLVLDDYVFGTSLTTANFVSFSYSSNLTAFTMNGVLGMTGSFSTLPGSAYVTFYNSSYTFSSFGIPGVPTFSPWCTGATGVCASDFGPTSSWALTGTVPEPATWAVMVLGFGIVGAGLRRSRRIAAYA